LSTSLADLGENLHTRNFGKVIEYSLPQLAEANSQATTHQPNEKGGALLFNRYVLCLVQFSSTAHNVRNRVMKIFYINNTGSGFADQIEVADGSTLGQVFAAKMPGSIPSDFLIRVNRQPAAADELLTEGCRVSITPVKIEGAIAA